MAPSKSPKAEAKKTVKTVKTKKGTDEKKKSRRR
jgi:histone H2B